jgi:asparagine synthetase B (glutamine-hydrolysing)
MCGILFTNKLITDLQKTIKYLKLRGPDHTEHKIINGYSFVHVLLSMTGEGFTVQPFIYDNIVVMFNGEIYNYKDFGDFNSDGECIIESYKKYGHDFVKYLDGEFAIVLVDFNTRELFYSTDIFSTKPLWVAIDGKNIGVASYESCLKELNLSNIKQVTANTTIRLQLDDLGRTDISLGEKRSVYDFDLTQHKTNFDDWNTAFEKAVIKRVSRIKHGVFLGLSAGYDSGLIACVLSKLGHDYKPYSILGSENPDIIKQRHEWKINNSNSDIINITRDEFLKENAYLKHFAEEYCLKIENGERQAYIKILKQLDYIKNQHPINMELIKQLTNQARQQLEVYKFRMKEQFVTDDNGSIGLSFICRKAKKEGYKIYLSGSGADEIYSDYGFKGIKHYGHSTIGGHYPSDLATVFPWKNFFDNTQRSYLMKEEIVSGAHSVEGRYPFLDKQVVQEFIWLSADLKNENYKSVIYNYLNKEKYPFEENKKVGFGCGFSGPSHIPGNSFKKITTDNKQFVPVGTTAHMQINLNFDKECETYIEKNKIVFEKLFDNI